MAPKRPQRATSVVHRRELPPLRKSLVRDYIRVRKKILIMKDPPESAFSDYEKMERQLVTIASTHLVHYANSLTSAYGIDTERARQHYLRFVRLVDKKQYLDITLSNTWRIRLADPHLTDEDRALFLNARSNPARAGDHLFALAQRMRKSYTGSEDLEAMPTTKRYDAFIQLCRAYFDFEDKYSLSLAYAQRLKKSTAGSTWLTKAEHKRFKTMTKDELDKTFKGLEKRFIRIPPGNRIKQWAYRRMIAIADLLTCRNISSFDLFEEGASPGYGKPYARFLHRVQKSLKTFEKSDERALKARFKSTFSDAYVALLMTPPEDQKQRSHHMNTLAGLNHIAHKIGFSLHQIRSWVKQVQNAYSEHLTSPASNVHSMKDLCRGHHRLHLNEIPFPKPLIDPHGSLETLEYLYAVPHVKISDHTKNWIGGSAAGAAYPFERSTEVALCDENPDATHSPSFKPIQLWEINALLVHEAWHNATFEGYRDINPVMLKPVPNERLSYAAELGTLRKLRDRMIVNNDGTIPTAKELKSINEEISEVELIVRGANLVLGYPENDFTLRDDLPHNAHLRDLNLYPTQAVSLALRSETRSFVQWAGLSGEDAASAERALKGILAGKIVLNGKGITKADDDGESIANSMYDFDVIQETTFFESGRRIIEQHNLENDSLIRVLRRYFKIRGDGTFDQKTFLEMGNFAKDRGVSTLPLSAKLLREFERELANPALKKLARNIARHLKGLTLTEGESSALTKMTQKILKDNHNRFALELRVKEFGLLKQLIEDIGLTNTKRSKRIASAIINIARLFYDRTSGRAQEDHCKTFFEEADRDRALADGFNTSVIFGRKDLMRIMQDWYLEEYHDEWMADNPWTTLPDGS